MNTDISARVVVVDYGLGNLFSIKHACNYAGMEAVVTSSSDKILSADAVILPGVGAFADAMNTLKKLDLVRPIQDFASSGKTLIGICLGLQLLFSESYEFGQHKGLDIIKGDVVRFENDEGRFTSLKVPQVGWKQICSEPSPYQEGIAATPNRWNQSFLSQLSNYTYMYFVHSYYVCPENKAAILSFSRYGGSYFCSSIEVGNVFACQFHPERSGQNGLKIYENIFHYLKNKKRGAKEL